MKKQVLVFVFSIFFMNWAFDSFGQNTRHRVSIFPKDFLGEWEGWLLYYKSNNTIDTVPMQFNVLPTEKASEYSCKLSMEQIKKIIGRIH